jgi:hypothetical protein
MKVAERARNSRGAGTRKFVQVAEVGRTHRAPCPSRSRKTSWRESRALAGGKLEAPPDAGLGWRNGETVRGRALTIKSTRWFGLWVSARRFSIRQKTFSGFHPSCLHRQGDVRSFGSQGNPIHSQPPLRWERRGKESASDDTEIVRACLQATVRASDGRHGSVKAPRGPTTTKRSPHPRRWKGVGQRCAGA